MNSLLWPRLRAIAEIRKPDSPNVSLYVISQHVRAFPVHIDPHMLCQASPMPPRHSGTPHQDMCDALASTRTGNALGDSARLRLNGCRFRASDLAHESPLSRQASPQPRSGGTPYRDIGDRGCLRLKADCHRRWRVFQVKAFRIRPETGFVRNCRVTL